MTVYCFIYALKVWLTTIFISPVIFILTECIINGEKILTDPGGLMIWYLTVCFFTVFCSLLVALIFWIFASSCAYYISNSKARLAAVFIFGLLLTIGTTLIIVCGLNNYYKIGDIITTLIPYCLTVSWSMLFFRKKLLTEYSD
jgi:ABC-type spermidine/putrescine transport system permease subunit I